jgi:hypothetical protein
VWRFLNRRRTRVLAFTCSRHRPLMLRHCIMQMQRQTYPADHVIYVNSPDEAAEDFTTLNYEVLLDDLVANSASLLKIGYGPTLTPQNNYVAALSQITLDRYDVFLKIDDDDIYLHDYVMNVVRDYESFKWDYSGSRSDGHLNGHRWRRNVVIASLGLSDEEHELGIPDVMPSSLALSRRGIQTTLNLHDTGEWEDVQWRRHLARTPGIKMSAREDSGFIYNIHGDNVSTGSWHES